MVKKRFFIGFNGILLALFLDICLLISIRTVDHHGHFQSATTLSGGEAQRMKLASELHKRSTGKSFYILDEPTTGLHTDDIARLLKVLQRFVDDGNTVLVIEHNLDVIKTADHIIDLGPEGGVGGGTIVATGTPEEVAAVPESYTGQYLKEKLT